MQREFGITIPYTIEISRLSKRGKRIFCLQADSILGLAYWRDDDEIDYRVEEIRFEQTEIYTPSSGEPFKYIDSVVITKASDPLLFDALCAEIHHGDLMEAVAERVADMEAA